MSRYHIRTALIGCGKVGQIHAAALRVSARVGLRRRLRRDPERAAAFAARYGVAAVHRRRRHAPRRPASQAVFICTPHPLHAEPAILAAEAGVHVLVEKPLAASLADCDAMLAAARKAGVKLGVISQRRFYEPVLRMKDAIDAGKIGRPVLGVFSMYQLARPGLLPVRPLARQVGHRGRRRARQPVAAPARPAASGSWATSRRGQRLLGQPQPSRASRSRTRPSRSSGSRAAGSARSSPACRRSRASTPRSTSTGRAAPRSASRPTAARRSSPAMSAIAEPPLNDLWTIPGEEHRLAEFQAEDRARLRARSTPPRTTTPSRSRTSSAPSSRTGRRW